MKMIRLFVFVCVVVLLAACGGGQGQSVEEILNASADEMESVDTVSFVLEREGDPLVLDSENDIAMVGATGVYQAPSDVYATVQATASGFIAEAEVIWNSEGAFFKLPPLIPSYTVLEGDIFDPSIIFSAEQGIPAVLRNGLTEPTLQGEEDLDGTNTYHISSPADAEVVSNLFGASASFTGPTIDVWISTDTNELVRVLITEADGESTWLFDFFDYGEPVEIPEP